MLAIQPTDFALDKTGMSYADLFEKGYRPIVFGEAEGVFVIEKWDEAVVGVPQPSNAELQAYLAGPPSKPLLKRYAALIRYKMEISGVEVSIGGETVTMATDRESRDGARDTLLAIVTGLRPDKAIFKFVEGPRSATNAEMQAAIGAAFGFVQAVYDKEGVVDASIDKGKIKSDEDIMVAFETP